MGILIKNIARHEIYFIIRPPSTGPAVNPAATAVPTIPNALPLSEAGKASTTSAGEQAISIAAAIPCKTRAAINHLASGDIPHNKDAIEKIKNPLFSSFRKFHPSSESP